MGLQIRRTGADNFTPWHRALVCGPPGSGKTMFASTWPEPLYVVTPGTPLRSIAALGVPTITVQSSTDIMVLKALLEQSSAPREEVLSVPMKTIVVDCLDDIQDLLITERLKEKDKDAFETNDWVWLGEQLKAITKMFLSMPDAHIVILCHVKTERDDRSGVSHIKPALTGQAADRIPGFVDLCALLVADTKVSMDDDGNQTFTPSFKLRTWRDERVSWVKDHNNSLPPELELNFKDDFARIDALISGAKPETTFDPVEITVQEVETALPSRVPAVKPEVNAGSCEACGETLSAAQKRRSFAATGKALCVIHLQQLTPAH